MTEGWALMTRTRLNERETHINVKDGFFFHLANQKSPSVCGGIGLLVYEDFYLKLALIIRQELPDS